MHFSNHRTASFKSPAWKREFALFLAALTPASVSATCKSGWTGVLTLTQSPSFDEDSDDPFGDLGFAGDDGFAFDTGDVGAAASSAGGSSSELSSSTIAILRKP